MPRFALTTNKPLQQGIALDLDSRYGVSLGTGVSSWADANPNSAGLGTALIQASGPSQPSYTSSDPVFGGKPSLAWSSGQALTVASFVLPVPYTVYIIGRFAQLSTASGLIISNTTTANLEFPFTNTTPVWRYYDGAQFNTSTTTATTGVHAFALVMGGLYGSVSSAMYLDSTIASPILSTNAVNPNNLSGNLQLSYATAWSGSVSRIVFYSVPHGGAQVSTNFRAFSELYAGGWA